MTPPSGFSPFSNMASSTSTILILNLPPKTFIGIDLLSFTAGGNFHGVINLPAGIHFLFTGTDPSLAIRHGQWLQAGPTPQPYVFRWSTEIESLELLRSDADIAHSAVRSIRDLRNPGLVDYMALQDASADLQSKQNEIEGNALPQPPSSDFGDWASLTSFISSSLLSRVLSPGWTISSISSAPADTESIPGLTHLETSSALHQSTLNLVPINLKQTWLDSDVGRARTDKARDRSWYLGHLIDGLSPSGDRQRGAAEFLGELQFCFLMVLTLANYSCLEQWKRILGVLFRCQSALKEVEGYFVEVVKVLRLQLGHVEDVDGGLFDLKDESSSAWLRQLLSKFRGSADDILGEKNKLKDELTELEDFMRDRYGWQRDKDIVRRGMLELEDGEKIEVSMDGLDEEEETGDYAPVVVDM